VRACRVYARSRAIVRQLIVSPRNGLCIFSRPCTRYNCYCCSPFEILRNVTKLSEYIKSHISMLHMPWRNSRSRSLKNGWCRLF